MSARVVMVQGTGSSVGKSFIAAGLCRMFARDGFRVAPFKAQNMSLNSAVTPDGLEIGRAQAVQADAAMTAPTVEMNPVLLKPEGDMSSQLVLMGKMDGSLRSMDFPDRKRRLWGAVTSSLDALRSRFDVVVIEGAGSPAEINLRRGDIVNMEVALYARAPVLLVGDIDKGGVFAALYGTLALISERERERVAGFIINKFRGDVDLLKPGLDMFEDMVGKPVIGVLPYLTDVYVPEEDSPKMARVSSNTGVNADGGALDVAVVALPRMANFDEFDPLARRRGVRLRYIRNRAEFGAPDLLILPGSKTTAADLAHLRRTGMEADVRRHLAAGLPIIGVCAGMQMLGASISDPHGVESDTPRVDGMGALDIDTEFARRKTTARVNGVVERGFGLLAGADGMAFGGYEIHVGVSASRGGAAVALRSDGGAAVGFLNPSGRALGTCVHDLFKNGGLTERILQNAAEMSGAAIRPETDPFSQDAEYDKLANYLRQNLDTGMIYGAMGLR